MCGVIVVDAGRSRFTNLGHDAYILIIAWICHDYLKFYQLPNSNLFTHRVVFSREKLLVKSTAPGSIFYHIAFKSIFHRIFSRSIIPKTQKYFAALFICIFYFASFEIYLFNLSQFLSRQLGNFWRRYPKERLTTPLTRRVASICFCV